MYLQRILKKLTIKYTKAKAYIKAAVPAQAGKRMFCFSIFYFIDVLFKSLIGKVHQQ